MNKKLFFVIPALALLLVGVGTVSAAGGFFGQGRENKGAPPKDSSGWQMMIEEKAKLLGISVEELKNYWVDGKDIWDIAKDKGIDEATLKSQIEAQRKAQRIERETEFLKQLVADGKITQAQADARLKKMSEGNWGQGQKMGGCGCGMAPTEAGSEATTCGCGQGQKSGRGGCGMNPAEAGL